MTEPTRTRIECSATIDNLIHSVCRAVENMRPGEVGEWYAERLERCARMIREKCQEAKESP